jgi:cyclopropane fatty-acyl-phospholipid synthase-like methyltransferase
MIAYARKQNGHTMVDYEAVGFLSESCARFLTKRYDTVIFQESLQYLKPLKDVFSTVFRLLPPGGRLIIGDEVRLGNELQDQTAAHSRASILQELNASGFHIENHLEIGRHVSMTCDHVIERFKQNFNRIVGTVGLKDTADKLRYFLDGWQAQREWYHKQLLGYDVFAARRLDYISSPNKSRRP